MMNLSKWLIGLLFVALMLLAAGVGALLAGETVIGISLLSPGVVLLIADICLLIKFRPSL